MTNKHVKRSFTVPTSRKERGEGECKSLHGDSPMKLAKIKYMMTVTFVMM